MYKIYFLGVILLVMVASSISASISDIIHSNRQGIIVYKCTGTYIPNGSQHQGNECSQAGGQCCDSVSNVNDPNTSLGKDNGAFSPTPNAGRSCPACYSGTKVPA